MMHKLLKNLQNQSQHYDESVISYANRLREIGLEIIALRKQVCNDFNDPLKKYIENVVNNKFINGLKTDIKVRIKNFDSINDVIENAAKIEKRLNILNQESKISYQSIHTVTCSLCHKKGHFAKECYGFTSTLHNKLNKYSKCKDEIFDRSHFRTSSLSYTLDNENCVKYTEVDHLCTNQMPQNQNTIAILEYKILNKTNDQITNSNQTRISNTKNENVMLDYGKLEHCSTPYPIKNYDISIKNYNTESRISNLNSQSNAFVSALNEQNTIKNVTALSYASSLTTDCKSNTITCSNKKDFSQHDATQSLNSNTNLKSKTEKNKLTFKQKNVKPFSQMDVNKTSQTLKTPKTFSDPLNIHSNSNNVFQIHSTNSNSLSTLHEKPISVESKIITIMDSNTKKESKTYEKNKVSSENSTKYTPVFQNFNQNKTLCSNALITPVSQISNTPQSLKNSEKFKCAVSNEIFNTCNTIISSNKHYDKKMLSTTESIPIPTSNLQSKIMCSELTKCEKIATEAITKTDHFNAQMSQNITLPKCTPISTKNKNILTCEKSISISKNICTFNGKTKKFVTFKITNKCKNMIFNASNKTKTTTLFVESDINKSHTSKSIEVDSNHKNLNQNLTCIINNSLYSDSATKLSDSNFSNFNSKIMNETPVNKNTTLHLTKLLDSLIDPSKITSTNFKYYEPKLNLIFTSNIKTSKNMYTNVPAIYDKSGKGNVQYNKVDIPNKPELTNLSILFKFYNNSLQTLLKIFKINNVLQNMLKHECNSQLNSVLKLMPT